jgi:hypothetical protein
LSSSSVSTSYRNLLTVDAEESHLEPIDVDAIEILDKIGGGNFGEVFRYQFCFKCQ